MGGPITLPEVRGVARPNHIIRFTLQNGFKDRVASAKDLVGRFVVFLNRVVRAANRDTKVGWRGTFMIELRGFKTAAELGEFPIDFDGIAVLLAGFNLLQFDGGGIGKLRVRFNGKAPLLAIVCIAVLHANQGGLICLNPDRSLAHFQICQHWTGYNISAQRCESHKQQQEGENFNK